MRGWRGPTEDRPFPSLGWNVLNWTYAHLPNPQDETKPLVYTPEQARRIVWWYEIHPVTGEWVRLRMILEEAKGFGKSPFAASLMIAEFRGPVCFDGWDANGEPVGVPWGTGGRPVPWIQIAAVSEDQTDNTYGAGYSMLAARGGAVADELGIDLGRTRLLVKDMPSAVLEPVTASAGSREGQRLTGAVRDETHLWTPRNGGVRLARTISRNVAKMGGRVIDTTNAPVLGEKSVAEMADPDSPDPGTLHFARRPRRIPEPEWSDEALLAELDYVYDNVPWADTRRLLREARDPSADWNDVLRFWFNLRTASTGRAVDPRLWDQRKDPREVPAGTYIGLGFDGSISEDATILRGCTPDGYSFLVGAWVRPPGVIDWKVPRLDVHEKVVWAFNYYKVGRMLCDPPKWWTEIESWQETFGVDAENKPRVLALDTNSTTKFAPAVDRWLTALREGTHTHDNDPITNDHVKAVHKEKVRVNAAESDGRTLYKLVKGEDHRKIDAAIADVLALEAAMTMAPEPVQVVPRFISFDDD